MLKASAKRSLEQRRRSLWAKIADLWHGLHSTSFAIALSLTLTSLVIVALLHVWTRLEIVRIGYALSEQTHLHQALREHEQRLRLELASRKDPAAIERVARQKQHMILPDPTMIRLIAGAKTATSASTTAAASAERAGR